MSSELHRVWKDLIQAEDYEAHMAANGQAQANAELTRDLLLSLNLPSGARILIAGAGPGQMFEFVAPDFLGAFDVTFTDISEAFLAILEQRLYAKSFERFQTVVDDIENTKLAGGFAAILLTLVLEHVDWEKALAEVARIDPNHLLLIVQQNPPGTTALTAGRVPPASMRILAESVRPHLIDRTRLIECLDGLGYVLTSVRERDVPDAKRMCGFVFERTR